jgi:hypothetical protein
MSISPDAFAPKGSNQGNVLVFGGHYMHCGQLMEKGGTELRRFQASRSTEDVQDEALDVYLSTRVLRCACGFQIEIPE